MPRQSVLDWGLPVNKKGIEIEINSDEHLIFNIHKNDFQMKIEKKNHTVKLCIKSKC